MVVHPHRWHFLVLVIFGPFQTETEGGSPATLVASLLTQGKGPWLHPPAMCPHPPHHQVAHAQPALHPCLRWLHHLRLKGSLLVPQTGWALESAGQLNSHSDSWAQPGGLGAELEGELTWEPLILVISPPILPLLGITLQLFQKLILANPLIMCDPDQEDVVASKTAKSIIKCLLIKAGGSHSCRI